LKQVRNVLLIALVVAFLTGNGGVCSVCFFSGLYHHLFAMGHTHEAGAAHSCCCGDHEDTPCEHFGCDHTDAPALDVALPQSVGKTARESATWFNVHAPALANSGTGSRTLLARSTELTPLILHGHHPSGQIFILHEQLLI